MFMETDYLSYILRIPDPKKTCVYGHWPCMLARANTIQSQLCNTEKMNGKCSFKVNHCVYTFKVSRCVYTSVVLVREMSFSQEIIQELKVASIKPHTLALKTAYLFIPFISPIQIQSLAVISLFFWIFLF